MTVSDRFNLLLSEIKPEFSEHIKALLVGHPLNIVTNSAIIDKCGRDVDVAATREGSLYVRLERIPVEGLDYVILHEMIHMYLEKKNDIKWSDYEICESDSEYRIQLVLVRRAVLESYVKKVTDIEAARLGRSPPVGIKFATPINSYLSLHMKESLRRARDPLWFLKL